MAGKLRQILWGFLRDTRPRSQIVHDRWVQQGGDIRHIVRPYREYLRASRLATRPTSKEQEPRHGE